MATTTGGTPYVQSSDLVSGWPATSLAVGNKLDTVASGTLHYSTGNHTITVAQILAGVTLVSNNSGAKTYTLPSASLVDGMQAKIVNINTGTVTVNGGTIAGLATIPTQYTGATFIYYSGTWYAVPFTSGSAKATVSATTGSPTITTVGTKTCYQFNGSGSITMTAGLADIAIIGGGGGGAAQGGNPGNTGGGGGGGCVQVLSAANFAAGTFTVTIGAGGAGSTYEGIAGTATSISPIFSGPGEGGHSSGAFLNGGKSGNGFLGGTAAGGATGPGGGGATANGANAAAGGAGGAGQAVTLTGSSVTYSVGGNGTGGAAGGANTGTGGGASTGTSGAGGSGKIIILIG